MPVSVIIYNLLAVLAFLGSAFFFWRRAREEHFELDQLFDGFIISFLVGFIVARFTHILLSFDSYGWSLVAWLNILSDAQLFLPLGVVAAGLYLYRFAKQRRWEPFEVLDIWVPAVLIGVSIMHMGIVASGLSHTLTIGPLTLPESALIAIFSLLLSRYLSWLELRYRTFRWYRSGRDVAMPGFIVAVGALLSSAYLLISTMAFSPQWDSVSWAYAVIYGLGMVFGLGLLLARAGKLRWSSIKRKKRVHT